MCIDCEITTVGSGTPISNETLRRNKPAPCDACLCDRFRARSSSLDLRICVRTSWPAFRDWGWKSFSFFGFLELEDALLVGDFFEGAIDERRRLPSARQRSTPIELFASVWAAFVVGVFNCDNVVDSHRHQLRQVGTMTYVPQGPSVRSFKRRILLAGSAFSHSAHRKGTNKYD